jgi:hypothetical protein
MSQSETIGKLAEALSKAQASMVGAHKDAKNPHFKSAYATLESCWDACRGPLTANGIAVIQAPEADGASVSVATVLIHSSGEWMSSKVSATGRDASPQSVGSCVTYLRRYGLMSMVGLAPTDDDDGESAQPRSQYLEERPTQRVPQKAHPTVEAAKKTFPGAKEADPWSPGRFKQACERLYPGLTEQDYNERIEGALEFMGCDRMFMASKGFKDPWALFASGPAQAREQAIMKAEDALRDMDQLPDFSKGDGK